MARRLILSLLLLLVFWPRTSRAEPAELAEQPARIADPDGVVTPALLRALRVELGRDAVVSEGADVVLRASSSGNNDDVVVSACGSSKTIDLQDTLPVHRTRTLALALSEVLRVPCATPVAAVDEKPREKPIDKPIEPIADRSTTKPAPSSLQMTVWAALHVRPTIPTLLIEPRAGVSIGASSSWLRGRFDAGWMYGATSDVIGRVEVNAVSGGAGIAAHFERGRFAFELGPRLELGAIFVRPTPSPGFGSRNVDGPLAGASLDSTLRLELARPLSVVFLARIGAVYGIEARSSDDRRIGGLDGFDAAMGAGLALDPF